jgi:carbonic anhydrase
VFRQFAVWAVACCWVLALGSDHEADGATSLDQTAVPTFAMRLGKEHQLPGLLMGNGAQKDFPTALQREAAPRTSRNDVQDSVSSGTNAIAAGSLFEVDGQHQLGETKPDTLKWTYQSTNWDKWPVCRTGNKQSPVNLQRPFFGAFLKLKQNYKDQLWPVQENDGRVLKVHFKQGDGSTLGIGDKEFTPVEAVFHSPSEHKLDGKSFDMEMQVIHKDTAGNMAGLSVLMQVSNKIPKDNFYIKNVFGHFFENLPKLGNKRRVESLNLKWILNDKMTKHYVTYHGSLTQPPCTEGMEWFVLGRPWLIEKKWLDSFKKVIVTPNIRPEQPRSERLFNSF